MTFVDAKGKNFNIASDISGGRYISNSTSNTLITGTIYADTIYNSGTNVTNQTGDGNDSIYHEAYSWQDSFIKVNAGAGDDTIIGRYGDSSIFGGAGSDIISLGTSSGVQTITSGSGNDTIYNSAQKSQSTRALTKFMAITWRIFISTKTATATILTTQSQAANGRNLL